MTVSRALLDHLIRRIRQAGPLPVSEYMALALGHPEHGYYMGRDPLGVSGDFITAPEISQMFGELLGLWCVAHWRALGGPEPVSLIELGPGRGTLMADVLRAARTDPDFLGGIPVHLVEISPVLRKAQAQTLERTGIAPVWHDSVSRALAAAPGAPFVIANEFFDALPVRQFVRGAGGWHERMIGLETDDSGTAHLAFRLAPEAVAPEALDHPCAATAGPGTVLELGTAREAVAAELGAAVARRGGAALIIDYGYARPAPGETLQAIRRHNAHGVLDDPGSADITAHVDFDALSRAARAAGAAAFGPVEQRAWLTGLGINERAAILARSAPEKAPEIRAALSRLTAADEMGSLFKVLAIAPARGPVPPGFGVPGDGTPDEGN